MTGILKVSGFRSGFGDFSVSADFSVGPNERVAIHAPSGSGKTTLLRWLAGARFIETESASPLKEVGTIEMNGENLTETFPEGRNFGSVFQDYALFTQWSAVENVGFGLEVRGVSKAERVSRSREWLEKFGLLNRADTSAGLLSGGEKQRVALGRALIWQPRVLLLDEPFAALDLANRASARKLVGELLAKHSVPTLFVTHDLEDVKTLATRTLRYSVSPDGCHHHFE
ncbi:MAG: ATP-binding cassette domain-containing protein [Cryobacterium sp.]|nr:ATP-binding cassette domain-containing protein [Oligoflexia bacterium]